VALWSSWCQAGGEPSHAPAARSADAPQIPWSALQYGAEGAGGSVSIQLRLDHSSLADLGTAPQAGAQGSTPEYVSAAQLMHLSASAEAKSFLGGSRSQLGVWFDADSGAVLKRAKLRPGSKGNQKVYRFAVDGAHRIRREPANREEAQLAPEQWTRIKRSFYPYDAKGAGCQAVSEPTLLLYLIARQGRAAADTPESVCVFLDDSLYRVRFETRPAEPLDISYKLSTSGADRKTVSGKQAVVQVTLQVEPLSDAADRADFELLELRGDIAILVSSESGLPLQLSGTRSGAGEIKLRLEEATPGDSVNSGVR
jgi:hypothetical protein